MTSATAQDINGVDWHIEVYDFSRDLIPLRIAAKAGDRAATAAVVTLAATAYAMEAGHRPGCAGCEFTFGGFRRPAGVVAAIRCDDAGMAPLSGPLCHFCIDSRPRADILDGLLEQVEAQAG